MIFSELYSAYYHTVSQIIARLLDGETDEKELQKIVSAYAFGESLVTILPSLKSGKWQLLCSDMKTPLRHKPTMPLTDLQKRWLKAVSLDARIRLFDIRFDGMEDIIPLFTPQDYIIYDRYADGDPYEDEAYIARFRFLVRAVREKMPIRINMLDRNGKKVYAKCIPVRLEYSEKDDKFRLLTKGNRFMRTVNLARILSCAPCEAFACTDILPKENRHETLVLKITDERNALERVMLHFAHFEKQAEQLDRKHYLLYIRYDVSDETELLIRVLSFGPLIEVVAPTRFIQLIKSRLRRQKEFKDF